MGGMDVDAGVGGMGSGGRVGAGGADGGSGGRVGAGGTDGGSDSAAGGTDGGSDSAAGGADGGAPRPCHTNADCQPDGGSVPGLVCFISALITECRTAPEGICVGFRGGNCGTHPEPCACLILPPTVACNPVPGARCDRTNDPNFSDQCYGCFADPDAGGDGG